MDAIPRLILRALCLAALLTLGCVPAGAAPSGEVDVLLVVALDVSSSVDAQEFDLQREGLARALESPQVAKAVASGVRGAIALTVVQWSGFQEQEIKIPWTRVSDGGGLARLAGAVRAMTRRYNGGATDIGGMIAYSHKLFAAAPFSGARQVLDIAGDGTNNVNRSPHILRDLAHAAGIRINALAIAAPPSPLPQYFRDKVIAGPGAFVETAPDYPAFEAAMKRKLLREIGGQLLF